METLNRALEKAMKFLMAAFSAIVFLVCFIQVVSRSVFQLSINWSQDIIRLCFIWAVFLGAAYCAKTNEQLNLDVVLSLLPDKTREIVEVIIQAAVLLFCVLLTVCGIEYVKSGMLQRAPYIPISMAWYFAAVPVSTGLMVFFYAQHIVNRIADLIKTGKESEK